MASIVEQLAERARTLPEPQRAALVELLLASLDDGPDAADEALQSAADDLEAVWDRELRERIARFEQGETRAFPATEVFAEARRRLRR
jgi:hypothetical protein